MPAFRKGPFLSASSPTFKIFHYTQVSLSLGINSIDRSFTYVISFTLKSIPQAKKRRQRMRRKLVSLLALQTWWIDEMAPLLAPVALTALRDDLGFLPCL